MEIAAEHEIHPVQLSKWKKEFLENAETVFGKEAKKAEKIKKAHEKEKLIKEIGQLIVEVNWLKKNLVSNKNLSERKALVNREDSEITIKRQCELLTVIRSVFYYQKKGVSLYELTLKREIDIIHTQIPFYGSRKITQLLKNKGYCVNRKQIVKYMRGMNSHVIYPKPYPSSRIVSLTFSIILFSSSLSRTGSVIPRKSSM